MNNRPFNNFSVPFKKNSTLFIPPQDNAPSYPYQNNAPFYPPQYPTDDPYFQDDSSPFEPEDEVYGTFREIFSQVDNMSIMKPVTCLEFDPYEETLWYKKQPKSIVEREKIKKFASFNKINDNFSKK